jgi:hypothetical protein
LDTSAHGGLPALPEAEDALHWAIQSARIAYPVRAAPVEVRAGPAGDAGIFVLPLADLVRLARTNLHTTFTATQCARYGIEPCPSDGGGLASPATAGARALPVDRSPARSAAAHGSLAGTTVTVLGRADPDTGLGDEFEAFERATGIHVEYQVMVNDDAVAASALASGDDVPDIVLSYAPGDVTALAHQHELVDLSGFLDVADVRSRIGDYLVDINSIGSHLYGVPLSLYVWLARHGRGRRARGRPRWHRPLRPLDRPPPRVRRPRRAPGDGPLRPARVRPWLRARWNGERRPDVHGRRRPAALRPPAGLLARPVDQPPPVLRSRRRPRG